MKTIWRISFCLLLLAVLAAGATVRAQGLPSAEVEIALEQEADPLHKIIMPRLYSVIASDVSPSLTDATLINRMRFIISLAMVDAAAPYHPTAVGMYSRIPRRPIEEWTDRYINVAMLYAAYNALLGLLPEREPIWREMLTDFGLDPDDGSNDVSTAVGIGNVAGRSVHAARLHDGMNQAGNYLDTTGYVPVNTAYELNNPARWQPGLRLQGIGVYSVQHFVTPQLANMEPMAPFDPRLLRADPPEASDPQNWETYKAQADGVLETSANLSDEQKLKAELFDNKIVSLGASYLKLAQDMDLSPADIARGYFLKSAAWMDASIATWQEKARFDAVRPFSAIRYVYGSELVTAWAGPGEGTGLIPANQWRAYLSEADHPEYPSGSTCGCYAHAQALRRFSGKDELNWSVTYPAGSSRVEPGVTPARDTTLTFDTWTEFAEDCGDSRHWAGVHFTPAVEASASYCSTFGDLAYEYYVTLMDGSAPLRAPAQALAPDPWLATSDSRSAAPAPVPKNSYPTPVHCENVSDSAEVTSLISSLSCAAVDTSGLSLLTGFLDAIMLDGDLSLGAQVCFNQYGAVALIEDGSHPPSIQELTTYHVSNNTCAWIDQPGIIVLVASTSVAAGTAEDADKPVFPFGALASCEVETLTDLNFRAQPGGERLGGIFPGTRLTAIAKTNGWYQVEYEGQTGWISADYVRRNGSC